MRAWRRFAGWVLYEVLPSRVSVALLASVCGVRRHQWTDFYGYESCGFCGKERPGGAHDE